MSEKKLITVFGATGNQGKSVISTWLATDELRLSYAIRAVTRDGSKPTAQELQLAGCELVEADMNDTETLKRAVEGAWGVFSMTSFWESANKQTEFDQGKAIADAALAAGVKHIIWSSLPHTTKLTDGKLPQIDHFVGKAEVEEYIEANKSGTIATYYMPGFFMSNFSMFVTPASDGLAFRVPFSSQVSLPLLAASEDTGPYVFGIFEAGSAVNGARIHGVSEWLSGDEFTDQLSKYAGAGEIKFSQVPRDVFKNALVEQIGEHLGEANTQAMEFIGDYSYFGKGSEVKQTEHDEVLLEGSKKTTIRNRS